MVRLAVLLLVAVTELLGGGFADAEVSGRELSTTRMEIEIQVEIDDSAGGSVAAHLVDPGGSQDTIALRERSPGLYGGFAEVRRIDYLVIFEVLGEDPDRTSEAVRLTDLGLDPLLVGRVLEGGDPVPDDETDESVPIGWLGLGVTAAGLALGLVVFAVLPRSDRPGETP